MFNFSTIHGARAALIAQVRGYHHRVASLLVLVAIGLARPATAQQVRDYDPHLHAMVVSSPPTVTLQWQSMSNAASFAIARRPGGQGAWQVVAASLPGTTTSWVDQAVEASASYEYKVSRVGSDGTNGVGYLLAGIEAPFPDDAGAVVMLVDKAYTAAIADRVDRLQQDLLAEGWTVVREEIDATATPPEVRGRLQTLAAMLKPRLSSVVIVGEVPIAYSGYNNPDGHPQHRGAWPADTYYADLDGVWTDTLNLGGDATGTIEGPNDRQVPLQNLAGDGKFDQDTIPSDLDLSVGRIDARYMPSLAPATAVDLVGHYLDNDHAFRTGAADPLASHSVVVDLLNVFSGDPLARMAWRDGTAAFGAEPMTVGPQKAFFAAVESPGGAGLSFAISYGHVDGSDAIGGSGPFRGHMARSFHFASFGSFFGDWITRDNQLRDAIFHPGAILGATWSNWPDNHYHQLGALWTIGATLIRSYNNELGDQTRAARGIHSGLMGDPTLRLFVTKPPTALQVTSSATGVALAWHASPDQVVGYHVYRATPGGQTAATRLTTQPVTDTKYLDATGKPGSGYEYRVVGVRLVTTGSGTFFDQSAGAIATTDGPPDPSSSSSVTDAGAGDAGGPSAGAAGGGGARQSSNGGASGQGGVSGQPGTGAGKSGGAGSGGAAAEPDTAKGSGCSCLLTRAKPAGNAVWVALTLAVVLVNRRRRRQ